MNSLAASSRPPKSEWPCCLGVKRRCNSSSKVGAPGRSSASAGDLHRKKRRRNTPSWPSRYLERPSNNCGAVCLDERRENLTHTMVALLRRHEADISCKAHLASSDRAPAGRSFSSLRPTIPHPPAWSCAPGLPSRRSLRRSAGVDARGGPDRNRRARPRSLDWLKGSFPRSNVCCTRG
jgi:hypothetical protein